MKQHSIKGQTAFITGASSGIGKSCAELFASIGVNLVITGRRIERIETLAKELSSQYHVKVKAIKLDVQSNKQVEAVYKELEKEDIQIDILINNAGLGLTLNKMQDGDISNWDTMIDTNIKGLLYITKAFLPSMIKKNHGHIINIGSVAGRDCYPSGNIYCATKHAVKAISQSLRLDLVGTSIRISEIAPGAVETEFSEVRFADKVKAKEFYKGFTPLIAEDIADAVIYCATRPSHVNISELVIFPQAQASVRDLYRSPS